MKNRARIASLGIAILAGFATESGAAGSGAELPRAGKGPSFAALDANGDGQLTHEEAMSFRIARFESIDLDADGQVTRAEMETRFEKMQSSRRDAILDRVFARRDANGDGVLVLAELADPQGGKIFKTMDLDGNGSVSEAEFEAQRKKLRDRHRNHSGSRLSEH